MEERVRLIHLITELTRFRLLELLSQRHYCVRALSMHLGISESAVSQHLKMLKEQGIVDSKRIGYQTHYIVNSGLIADALKELLKLLPEDSGKEELSERCSCEFMPECIRNEGIRQKRKRE